MPLFDALLVAAGRGQRLGGTPKQLRDLDGKAVVAWSAEAFLRRDDLGRLVVVVGEGMEDEVRTALAACASDMRIILVTGGPNRQASVARGLKALHHPLSRFVMVHDAARPFLHDALIDRLLAGLHEYDGVVPVLPVSDALSRETDGALGASVDRAGIVRVQTPQAFHHAKLQAAYAAHTDASLETHRDDSSVARAAGMHIGTVRGDEAIFKITHEDDWARAVRQARAISGEVRVGHGFDVHRFGGEGPVHLCGVAVPHAQGLVGHSDADVGLHALTDAILGALGDGDIGTHFSPREAQWRNADSALFVMDAVRRAREQGWQIGHADITLICEAPRVGPHRPAMVMRVQKLIGHSSVSIKATTTERLGFTGREEGIAALATVSLARA